MTDLHTLVLPLPACLVHMLFGDGVAVVLFCCRPRSLGAEAADECAGTQRVPDTNAVMHAVASAYILHGETWLSEESAAPMETVCDELTRLEQCPTRINFSSVESALELAQSGDFVRLRKTSSGALQQVGLFDRRRCCVCVVGLLGLVSAQIGVLAGFA